MGNKQFSQEVSGVSEIQDELKKMNADGKKNYIASLTAAITGILSLIVALVALLKG